MSTIPLPDVLEVLTRFLMQRDGAADRIRAGFAESPIAMQEAYPLEKRLDDEIRKCRHTTTRKTMAGALPVVDVDGTPVTDAWTRPDPVPLYVRDAALSAWLEMWFPKGDVAKIMRECGAQGSESPGRPRTVPDKETIQMAANEIGMELFSRGGMGYVRKKLITQRLANKFALSVNTVNDKYRLMEVKNHIKPKNI